MATATERTTAQVILTKDAIVVFPSRGVVKSAMVHVGGLSTAEALKLLGEV